MEITVKVTGHQQAFRTALAGVTYANADGTSRQAILKTLKAGEPLTLKREPGNEHDRHAVAVFRSNGQQVGYMPAGDARLANHIDSGGSATARVLQVTGGRGLLGLIFKAFRKNYGCVVEIRKNAPDWKAVAPFMEQSRAADDLNSKAQLLEVSDPAKAVDLYRQAVEKIVELDGAGAMAASWRRARYPINRLSMLLDKQGDDEGALEAIRAYENFHDNYGISPSDKKSVASRKARLEKRAAKGKKNEI
jgi:hypothetical protein